MAKHGGKREGAGRPSKADEIKLIEKLSPLFPDALKALENGVKKGDFKFVQLYLNYFAGKPKESKDITSNGETIHNPIVIFGEEDNS